jgi:oligoribonuclease (3'-5' exoribonuclease)
MTFNHIMVDLETTGVCPDRNGIIQIAAYRFGLKAGEIDPAPFNRCLFVPAWRSWDMGTLRWWRQDAGMRETLQNIESRAEDPATVLAAFRDWVFQGEGKPIFWSKPSHFDWGFLQSTFKDFSMEMPFHYRFANDMNSYIRGAWHPHEMVEQKVEMHGAAHDAVYDVLNQIQVLWASLRAAEQAHANN